MAICNMSKVLIVGHLSEFDCFVDELQHRSVFHPDELSQFPVSEKETQPVSDAVTAANPRLFHQLDDVRSFLEPFRPKTPFIQTLLPSSFFVKRTQYQTITESFNPQHLLESAAHLKNCIDQLNKKRETQLRENTALEPWKNVAISIKETIAMKHVHAVIGRLDNKNVKKVFDLENVECEILERGERKTVILLACHSDHGSFVQDVLKQAGFEEMPVQYMDTSPQNRYRRNRDQIVKTDQELNQLSVDAKGLLKDFDSLSILLAYYHNLEKRSALFDYGLSTKNAFIISGWVRELDLGLLESILASFKTIQYEKMAPSAEDAPPVSFKNVKVLAPFELITRLYSAPAYGSLDPSAVVSIFFVLFFSLCLTDAGYGLILCITALFGLRKLKVGREILWILFWGGFFTLFAGLLTGGIFGDLFRSDNPYMNLPALNSLRDEMLWFDTLKEPMVFFRLVLLLGVIQVASGLAIGLAENVRNGKIADGLLDKGTWLVILASLLAVLFSSEMCVTLSLVTSGKPPLNSTVTRPALVLAAMMAVIVVCFSARDEKTLFFRFFVGFLKSIIVTFKSKQFAKLG